MYEPYRGVSHQCSSLESKKFILCAPAFSKWRSKLSCSCRAINSSLSKAIRGTATEILLTSRRLHKQWSKCAVVDFRFSPLNGQLTRSMLYQLTIVIRVGRTPRAREFVRLQADWSRSTASADDNLALAEPLFAGKKDSRIKRKS